MLPNLPQQSNFTPKNYDKFLTYGEWKVFLTELNSQDTAILQNLKASILLAQQTQVNISQLTSGAAGGDLTGNFPNPTIKSSVSLTGNPTTTTQATTDNSTRIATTAYVTTGIANAVAGVNPAVAVQVATTAAANTSGLTYSNGVAGVGATFTGTVNTAITWDGFTFTATGQRGLVKNDTQSPSGAFNGVYYMTQLQTAILPPILTRALDYNTTPDINNTGAIPVVNGTANALTSWLLTSSVTTIGTDALTYTQFSINPTTQVTTSRTISTTAPLTGGGDLSANRTIAISNATATTAGAVPTPPNNTTTFFRGDATFNSVTEAGMSLSDNTTNNVTSAGHGFAQKSPGDTTQFFRGGTTPDWAVPPTVTSTSVGYAPAGSILSIPNVVLIGKSLGSGTSVTGITVSSGVATVTHTAHGYTSNDIVVISGATGAGVGDINQLHVITVTTSNAYTFTTTATGTIGGTIVEIHWFKGTRCLTPTLVKNFTRPSQGVYIVSFVNTQPDIFYGIQPGFYSNSSNNLKFLSFTNAPTTTSFEFQINNDGGGAADPTSYMSIYLTGII